MLCLGDWVLAAAHIAEAAAAFHEVVADLVELFDLLFNVSNVCAAAVVAVWAASGLMDQSIQRWGVSANHKGFSSNTTQSYTKERHDDRHTTRRKVCVACVEETKQEKNKLTYF